MKTKLRKIIRSYFPDAQNELLEAMIDDILTAVIDTVTAWILKEESDA